MPPLNSPPYDYLKAPPNVGVDGFLFGLWRISADGWERFAYGKWSKFPLPPSVTDPAKLNIGSIVEDSKRRIWYRTTDQRTEYSNYYAVSDGQLTVYPNFPKGYFVSYADADGNLWTADGNGHTGIWKDGKLEIFADLSTSSIVRILEDREGGLWVGTREAGLFRRRAQTVETVRNPNVTGLDKVGGLMQDATGKIWLAANGLTTFENKRFENIYSKTNDLGDVYALYEDRDASIIVGARKGVGRYANGKFAVDETLSAISPNTLRVVLRDRQNNLWLGYNSGLYRRENSGN